MSQAALSRNRAFHAVLHGVALLNGFGTLLLGPILPLLAARFHLNDAHSGLLLTSQFCGATLGGMTTSGRLRRGLLAGLASATAGLVLFGFARTLTAASVALVIAGFGIGRAITAVNLLAGAVPSQKGSALARVNLTWSVGALLSPLLAALVTQHVVLRLYLGVFAGAYLLMLVAVWRVPLPDMLAEQFPEVRKAHEPGFLRTLRRPAVLIFCVFLFLYGGYETCLNAWLTTLALRMAGSSLSLSQSATVLLLTGVIVGRMASTQVLRRMSEMRTVRWALLLSGITTLALAWAHSPRLFPLLAVLSGLSLAPIFPVGFALLLGHKPEARAASFALALSGLGAAALPAGMGWISSRTGSLGTALLLPAAAAAMMLGLLLLPAAIAKAQD